MEMMCWQVYSVGVILYFAPSLSTASGRKRRGGDGVSLCPALKCGVMKVSTLRVSRPFAAIKSQHLFEMCNDPFAALRVAKSSYKLQVTSPPHECGGSCWGT